MEYRNHVLYIGNHSAEELAARFGTPLYVYDAAVIRDFPRCTCPTGA